MAGTKPGRRYQKSSGGNQKGADAPPIKERWITMPPESVPRQEWFLGFSALTSLTFLLFGDTLFGGLGRPLWLGLIFLWLFAAILGSSLAVVRHAEHLAARLGALANPWGHCSSPSRSPSSRLQASPPSC